MCPDRFRGALAAAALFFTACGSSAIDSGDASLDGAPRDGEPSDASVDGARVEAEGGEASPEPGDASQGGDALDAPSEGDVATPCTATGVLATTLACTGLYSDIAHKTLAPGVRFYQPAVSLWADNATKMRWIQFPPGTQIDVSNPNEWKFPIGTKVWKEFSRDGNRVETRMFEKFDDGPPPIWKHATFAWNADESAATTSGGGDIPWGTDGGTYHIPTFSECDQCHNGRTDHVLGFEQVSLGEQGAAGLTLAELVKANLVTPVPARTDLVLGDDGTGVAAPALAWLHVNCGVTCHNGNSNANCYGQNMRLRLDPSTLDGRPITDTDFDALRTTISVAARTRTGWTRIVPGDPSHSLLVQFISYRGTNNPPGGQMPPIASKLVDTDDVAKVIDWVSKLPSPPVDAGPDADGAATTEDASDEAAVDDAAIDVGPAE